YIQAYTGTFASLVTQKKTYEKLLSFYPFRSLHIGTRPDCLSEATIAYLCELNETREVVVELGVQSLHDESLKRMNRGHDAACSLGAIKRLRAKGLKVYAHLIIGLPHETPDMWKQTVLGLVEAGIDGIKFHNLHIIKGTQLAREYEKKPFELLNEYAYAEALINLLRFIPSHIPIIRLSTDTPQKELIAPKWHMQKGQFGEYVAQSMRYCDIQQGDLVEKSLRKSYEIPQKINLKDGSTTFWSQNYRDYYHPKAGAYIQAQKLFLEKSELKERLKKSDVKLLDLGFGMGYNTFLGSKTAQNLAKHALHVSAIDHDKRLLKQSAEVVPESLHVKMLNALFTCKVYKETFTTIIFLNAEARYAVSLLNESFDIIFLDPFIESNNASLVSVEFFQMLRKRLKPDGILVASTTLQAVSDGLLRAGFDVKVANDTKSDIKGVIATPSLPKHLPSAHPYHDPHSVWSDKKIESEHQKTFTF
ncbi:MAG: TIGR01212 family radical SAM protein, partial [Campylobacteraceae bacterium]|nr:TIGR01212 family radical SAM protein [Campylobacteraceae bacterium]